MPFFGLNPLVNPGVREPRSSYCAPPDPDVYFAASYH